MAKTRVFLTGGDQGGWALDDDLEQTRRALEGIVEFADLEQCEVVHTVWWEALRSLPQGALAGKRVVCHLSAELNRYLKLPHFASILPVVGKWVAQSTQAKSQCDVIGIDSVLVPYAVDTSIFRLLDADAQELQRLRNQWSIPSNRYIIGNFHRDTEGGDLVTPKYVKGPDIFAEIVMELARRGLPVHVLLAGPRRFWLRRKLAEYGVPFTYVGRTVEADDVDVNRLPRSLLNQLYNLCDLYLVSSRSEGGPRSLLEAAASKCQVISTRVGLAEDILDQACIYDEPVAAVDMIRRDIENGWLSRFRGENSERVMSGHTPCANAALFSNLYENVHSIRPAHTAVAKRGLRFTEKLRHLYCRLLGNTDRERKLTVGLWHDFVPPPFGGGNQFMLALRKWFGQQEGVRVVNNKVRGVDVHLLNAVRFDVDRVRRARSSRKVPVLHRIDGPISLIRGKDRELDDLCFSLNKELASATIMQSIWTLQRSLELGYHPVRPVVVPNAVDPDIFNPHGRIPFDPSRKIRLISTSWSDNPRKGGAIYRWIESNLDWDRFDYTFVGRASESFQRIRQVEPVPSKELAELLRCHDIYITASSNDPCSNAVIEALACGLPVLYMNDGGHPELVGYGGLPFNDETDILPQLDKIAANYPIFRNLIMVPSLQEVAGNYLLLLREIAADA